jgi:hypothetical protein
VVPSDFAADCASANQMGMFLAASCRSLASAARLSRLPRIQAACRLLNAFEGDCAGIVACGSESVSRLFDVAGATDAVTFPGCAATAFGIGVASGVVVDGGDVLAVASGFA